MFPSWRPEGARGGGHGPPVMGLETGVIVKREPDGRFLVKRIWSGGMTQAIAVTPGKNMGIGYEVSDMVLLATDPAGTVFITGYVPPKETGATGPAHPLQRAAAPNDTLFSPDLDTERSGLSMHAGGVTRIGSGPASQTISSSENNEKVEIVKNHTLATGAAVTTQKTDKDGFSEMEIAYKPSIFDAVNLYRLKFSPKGLDLTWGLISPDGAFQKLSGLTVSMDGSVKLEGKTTVDVSALVKIALNAARVNLGGTASPIGSIPAATHRPNARILDRVITSEGGGIITSGSSQVKSL